MKNITIISIVSLVGCSTFSGELPDTSAKEEARKRAIYEEAVNRFNNEAKGSAVGEEVNNNLTNDNDAGYDAGVEVDASADANNTSSILCIGSFFAEGVNHSYTYRVVVNANQTIYVSGAIDNKSAPIIDLTPSNPHWSVGWLGLYFNLISPDGNGFFVFTLDRETLTGNITYDDSLYSGVNSWTIEPSSCTKSR